MRISQTRAMRRNLRTSTTTSKLVLDLSISAHPHQGANGGQQQNFQFNFGGNTFQGYGPHQGSGAQQHANFQMGGMPGMPDISGIFQNLQHVFGNLGNMAPGNMYP